MGKCANCSIPIPDGTTFCGEHQFNSGTSTKFGRMFPGDLWERVTPGDDNVIDAEYVDVDVDDHPLEGDGGPTGPTSEPPDEGGA